MVWFNWKVSELEKNNIEVIIVGEACEIIES